VIATFGLPAECVRRDYRLRGDHVKQIRQTLELHFRRVPKSQRRAGDVMLLKAGERQFHLAVRSEHGFVHAHAGIRRVVETPGEPAWPVLGVYRRRRRG
jgi:hypothetical protein